MKNLFRYIHLALFLFIQGTLISQVPTSGQLFFYPINDNADDESGNGANGVVHGAQLTKDRCGVENSAYDFNGVDDYISMGDVTNLDGCQALTISAWIFTNGITDAYAGTIVSKYNAEDDARRVFLFIVYPDLTLRCCVYGNDGNGDYEWQKTMNSIPVSQWNQVAVTWDGISHTMSLYVNGVKANSYYGYMGNKPAYIYDKECPLMVGCAEYGHTDYDYLFKGAIDEVRIYNRVLTDDEISKLYYFNCSDLKLVGEALACEGQQNVLYSVQGADKVQYEWKYSGSNVTINGDQDTIALEFEKGATSGNLSVVVSGDSIITETLEMPITVKTIPYEADDINGPPLACIDNSQSYYYSIPLIDQADSYQWSYSGKGASLTSTGHNSAIVFPPGATSGTLSVAGVNGCGVGTSSTLYISLDSVPPAAGAIQGETNVCINQRIMYHVTPVNNARDYVWQYSGPGAKLNSDGDSAAIYFSDESQGALIVSAVNGCGTGGPSPALQIDAEDCELFIPNAISPNGDGINDVFDIENLPEHSSLKIFNRLGKLLYETDNYNNNWDGRDRDGNLLDSGTYWYVLMVPYRIKEYSGFVYIQK